MLNISHIFNVKYSISRVFGLYPLFLSAILMYHGIILSLFIELSPVVSYAISFLLFSLFLFYKNYFLYINKWLIIALSFLLLSFFMGIYNDWIAQDMSADFARYLAPFLGFSAALVLLRRVTLIDLLAFLYFLGFIHLCFYYVSVYDKVIHVLDGAPIVEYAQNGLEVAPLYFLLFFFSFKKKIFNTFTYLLLAGYIIGFFLTPILLMSKAKMITTVLLMFFIFLFYSSIRQKAIMVMLALVTSSFMFNFTDYAHSLSRFTKAYDSIIYDEYHIDSSTSYRLAEIKNITQTLMEDPAAKLPLGLGLGALYYDTYEPIQGGVHAENYRPDGGLHHVFTVYFAYILRYGLIGLFIFFIWIYASYKKISKCKNEDPIIYNIVSSVKLYIVISLIADTFVPVHVYGNFSFGFFVAIGVIIASKSKYNKHSLDYKNE